MCAATCAGGSARTSSANAATWLATRSVVFGRRPICMPARTERAKSTVAAQGGQKTGSALSSSGGPPNCFLQEAHWGPSG
eukprot:2639240-Alexandrium_andersonii.AAC.1